MFLCKGVAIYDIMKMHYIFKILVRYSQAKIRQSKYIVIMTKEGSTKIRNFMNPGAGVNLLGRGHINHIVKMCNLLLYKYRALWLVLFNGSIMLIFYAIVDLYLSYDGAVGCKYEPFWLEVSVESLILRWLLRPVGFLFLFE